jgi:hypothetical protein
MRGDESGEEDPNQEKKYIEIGNAVLKDVESMVKKIVEQVNQMNRI